MPLIASPPPARIRGGPPAAARRLPVRRAVFDDPAATWFHIDPDTFDLGLLVRHRPAWDAVVILLLAAGSVIAVPGLVIAWLRLRRPRPAPAAL